MNLFAYFSQIFYILLGPKSIIGFLDICVRYISCIRSFTISHKFLITFFDGVFYLFLKDFIVIVVLGSSQNWEDFSGIPHKLPTPTYA